MYNYGIIVDQDMLANVIETNLGEAKSYFNANMIIWFFVMGAVPAYFIMKVNVKRSSAVRDVGHKLIAITLSLLVIGAIAGLYYKDDYPYRFFIQLLSFYVKQPTHPS